MSDLPPPLIYDPTLTEATLTEAPGMGWNLWTLRPDGKTGMFHLFTWADIGDAEPVDYFRQLLVGLGFTVTDSDSPLPTDYLAWWTLAPGQN